MAFSFRKNVTNWQIMSAFLLVIAPTILATKQSSSLSDNVQPLLLPRNLQNGGGGFDLGSWAQESWDNLVDTINEDFDLGFGSSSNSMASSCALVERAIGMGESFGLAADCVCNENQNFANVIDLTCNFDACIPLEENNPLPICGNVDLEVTVGKPNTPMDLNACAKMDDERFGTICVGYELATDNNNNNNGDNEQLFDLPQVSQTCSATYNGIPCACTIEDVFCVVVDCLPIMPGMVSVNSCQALSLANAIGLDTWIPDLAIFRDGFEQYATEIPWDQLDFDNLDFENFDLSRVQEWGNLAQNTWLELLGDNPNLWKADREISEGACRFLEEAANLSMDLLTCTCGFDASTQALEVSCDLEPDCDDSSVATVTARTVDLPSLFCGAAANLNLRYASLSEISAEVCLRYNDIQPELCYSYGLPFGTNNKILPPSGQDESEDLVNLRECSARYGNGNCVCTLDENSCLSVDCTGVAPRVLTETCQVVDVATPVSLILDIPPEDLEAVGAASAESSKGSMLCLLGPAAMAGIGMMVGHLF